MSRAAEHLHARLGASVFNDAIRDYAHGNLRRRTGLHIAALILSLVILATPFLTLAAGIAVLLIDFPNLLTLIVGAILIATGWALIPRRHRRKDTGLTRADAPALYALLDRIADELGTDAPDDVLLDHQFNASLFAPILSLAPHTRLTIGLPLWEALSDQERIALLAHELAHKVNDDNARGGPVGLARWVLESWIYFLYPADEVTYYDRRVYGEAPPGSLLTEILTGILYTVAEGLAVLLERLEYLDHNRAEYLADALASEVAGTEAMAGLLSRLALADLVYRRMMGITPASRSKGAALFDHIGEAAHDMESAEAVAALARMEEELLTTDRSHPPTRFRIGFIEAIGPMEPAVTVTEEEMRAIDAEFAPKAAELAEKLCGQLESQ